MLGLCIIGIIFAIVMTAALILIAGDVHGFWDALDVIDNILSPIENFFFNRHF